MSENTPSFNKFLARVFLWPLLALFLLPGLAYLFVAHGEAWQDSMILSSIEKSIDQSNRMPAAEKDAAKARFRANPPSSMCTNEAAQFADYRQGVCATYSPLWQFHWARRVAVWTLAAGGVALVCVLALGLTAFANRRAQYLSFLLGWRLLTAISALEMLVQGGLLVWLSYWVPAFFLERYYVKLIVLAGILVGMAVFYAVVCIFQRTARNNGVDGELLSPQDAPQLWARVRDVAARVQTAPPDHIVAGIDTNFFVTEAPLTVSGHTVTGRSLFVSLPLLRLMDRAEADAVLAHELAHLRGGDTASSAALGPKLAQYDHYCGQMAAKMVTVLAFFLLRMYRVIFEFALRRESRAREFLADGTAARVVSGGAVVHALIKVAAYAQYRTEIERRLFEHDRQHAASVGIARYIATGLPQYAQSAQFLTEMKSAGVPHPFDSHPPLAERMAHVGHRVDEQQFGQVAANPPPAGDCWLADIPTAEGVEQRLWARYEQQFAADHERSLAYRYLPATEAEQAVVLKYFPTVAYALKGGKQVVVNYEGLVFPGQTQTLSWNSVRGVKYEVGFGGDVLQITHPEKNWLGAKTTKVKLPGIGKQRHPFQAALAHYWRRHQYMVAQQDRGVS